MGEIIYLYILFSITVKIILNIREIIYLFFKNPWLLV